MSTPNEKDQIESGFGTGLRAALAHARDRRRQAEEEAAAAAEVVSPELALVAPELRRAESGTSTRSEAEPAASGAGLPPRHNPA